MLAIAGGTGISFVFPQILQLLAKTVDDRERGLTELVWIVRKMGRYSVVYSRD
ncbi:hypothetical protein GJ744_003752 [Endocarpon pusillum]|uniref:Ferric reductase NAD binding domain-containing protein n=1 Tax=Endocarpon pusillum TaxID=364733 RepID=A0A8H7AA51_9EURO|nr:hypothetical protein GJ744_003752 [Endocarpon pusillum]